MIEYDKKTSTFYLFGKTFTYAFCVNEWGYLQQLYYGKKIHADDLGYLREFCFHSFSPTPGDILVEGVSLDLMPAEYASFGSGDFRTPSAVVERGDGAKMSRFKYLRHEIKTGTPALEGLPCARPAEHAQTLCVYLADSLSSAQIKLNYTVFDDCDVLLRNAEIENTGAEPLKLTKAFSFCLDLPAGEYDVLRLQGKHCGERMPERTAMGHGLLRLSSERGTSSHQMNPFVAVMSKNADETQGECYAAALIYSGSFALTCEVGHTDTLRLQGGVSDFGFCWNLNGGEVFTTPQAVLCYSGEGLGQISLSLADFYREHIVSPRFVYAERPIVLNNWEATYFDFTAQKLRAIIDEAATLGVDTFVLDDGWFGKRDDDRSGLGDWFVNEKKLGGTLASVIEHCKQKGLKFGLWFEPEMISADSDLYRAHPDWAISKAGVTPCESRRQLVLDFTRPEIVDYIYSRMADILSRHDISYVKWDMNRHLTENYTASLPPERQGEFMHRYMLGVYRLAQMLTERFPDLLMEGCSGGGGRFDAGMLYYFPQIWTSDDSDAYERVKIQYGTSIAYPLSSMSCHVSVCPNHQTGRVTPLATRAHIASLGATGYELDPMGLKGNEKREIRKQIAAYKKISDLVLRGDFYRLSSPFDSNFFAGEVVSEDKKYAYVVCERIFAVPDDNIRRLRLRGLDPDTVYLVAESGERYHGSTLMHSGLTVPVKGGDFTTTAWHLSAIRSKK